MKCIQMSGATKNSSRLFMADDKVKKKCNKCKLFKLLKEFSKDITHKDGFHSICKECYSTYAKQYREKNKDEIKAKKRAYVTKNREKISLHRKKYCEKNREKRKIAQHNWYLTNRKKSNQASTNYRLEHKEELKAYQKKYRLEHRKEKSEREKEIRRNNISHKLSNQFSTVMRRSLKQGQKNQRHWEILIGYSLNQLIKHLKKTIPKDYTWQDFIDGKLHIDHKIPISVFNFEKPEDLDFRRCWALSNLQLLPIEKNISKGAKLSKPFQPSFVFG